ncbi:bacterio-opsin activator domain-containing protein [Halorientalis marina]|uniref:bacterio-opsin activator domain-containing protein n=1 Tax=Halorientalis marina TaxID=2931976 RepID=UPI001FF164DB|nr:bacterio-opsin activator domain-containing protein [Halorientalis marina]
MNENLQRAPVGVLETTLDGEIEAANPAAATTLDADAGELVGRDVSSALPRSANGTLREAFAGDPPDEQSIEEYYPEIDRWLEIDLFGDDDGVLLYVRDRTRRHDRTRTIDRLEHRLERVEAIDSLVATVLRKIIDASAREEVWHTVCDRLGTTDLYEFAWIGERDLTDDQLQIAASAGDAPELLDTISDQLGTGSGVPERLAVETESTRVVQTIADEDDMPRELRVAAFGRGLQSSIAVPLAYGETVYGVMGVYATREDGFSEQEVASLETLGALAGFAVNAIQQADLLFADTVTELTLSVADDTIPFVVAAETADDRLALDGAVLREDETVMCYLRAPEATEAVVSALDGHTEVSSVRAVQEGEETQLLEVGVSGATPITALSDRGATITDATYTPRSAEIVADLPSDGDVRDVVTTVSDRFDETEILSKETQAREPETMEAFRNDLAEALTDKQRTVLRTAHLSDYFTSPRGSTSEEVAEALDIAGPTVLYHLRNAQRKLLDAFFDEGSASDIGD